MIAYLKREEINIQKWDECILRSTSPQIFGCSFYLDVCCPDWSALILNDYEAVFPISVKQKYFIKHLTQPYFVRHFGVYNAEPISDFKPWIHELNKLASYFNFNVFNSTNDFSSEYKSREKIYQLLNLNLTYEALRKNYSESHIRKLKKISPLETTIVDITDYSIYINEFKNTITEKKLNYSDAHLKTLHQLMNELPKHCKVISKGLLLNGELVAGAYFVQYYNRLLYLKGFRKFNTENDGGMFLLFDSIIKENSNLDLTFDFGGSNNSNVRQFFKGFGAEDSVYLHLEKNELPRMIRWLKK
ncbi:MAG: hypothetical protein ACK44N_08860 [Bacteroidota bacterium]